MGLASRQPFALAHLLFATWLVAGAGSLTEIPPVLAVLFALLLTLLLLNRWQRARRVPRSGRDAFGSPDADEGRAFFLDDEWESWIEKYLPKLRAMRRRMRGKPGGYWLPTVATPDKTDPISTHLPRKRETRPRPRRGTRPGDDRASGLLLLSALLTSLLTVFTLFSESSRLVEQDARLFVFRLLELCGVVALPIVVGLVFHCALHFHPGDDRALRPRPAPPVPGGRHRARGAIPGRGDDRLHRGSPGPRLALLAPRPAARREL